MTELRLRELDNFLNSPIGKVYTAVVGMVFFYGGAKFIVKGIVDLGNGLAMAYGMDAATGQMIPVLVRSDGLVISEVIQSVSAGVAQVVTGITVNAFGELSTGDLTPGGRSLSAHGAERANERGFTPETIDSIIDNNMKTRSSRIDELGRKTWEYIDPRGNKVVTNEWGGIISVHSPAPGGVYIPK